MASENKAHLFFEKGGQKGNAHSHSMRRRILEHQIQDELRIQND